MNADKIEFCLNYLRLVAFISGNHDSFNTLQVSITNADTTLGFPVEDVRFLVKKGSRPFTRRARQLLAKLAELRN